MARPASRKAVSSLPAIANIDEQLDEVVMNDWIRVEDRTPENQDGKWSKDVIALSDSGDVFRLACMDGYWQRTQAFIDSGEAKVTHWMPLNYPDD